MIRRLAAVLMTLFEVTSDMEAGAWTLPQGSAQVFSEVVSSQAGQRFDNSGVKADAPTFGKLMVQGYVEYGLTDAVTLLIVPEYVEADTGSADGGSHIKSSSIAVGGRLLLSKRFGMLSVQSSVKSAGGFAMSTSRDGEAGRQVELRFLYGNGFKLLHRDGFLDIEVAKRWTVRPRPDEFAFDGCVGLWVRPNDLLLVQGFTILSGDGALRPYQPYLQTKVQASLVHRLTSHWSVQSGYFMTPAGRNMVAESGYVFSLWLKVQGL